MLHEGEVVGALMKAGFQGTLTGIGSGALFGFRSQVARGGRYTNIVLYTGLIGAISSLASDAVHKIAHKEIHVSQKFNDQAATVLGVATSAGLYYLALKFLEPESTDEMGLGKILAVGGFSEYAASFLSSMVVGLA